MGDLLRPGIEPVSPTLPGKFFTIEPPRKYLHLEKNEDSKINTINGNIQKNLDEKNKLINELNQKIKDNNEKDKQIKSLQEIIAKSEQELKKEKDENEELKNNLNIK